MTGSARASPSPAHPLIAPVASVPLTHSALAQKAPLFASGEQEASLSSTAVTAFSNAILDLPFTFPELNILVVDDNLLNQRVAVRSLTKLGLERVQTAADGQEACDIVFRTSSGAHQLNAIHVVLMDSQMPVMNGFEVALSSR